MNYFEIGTVGSQKLIRKMRMGYNLRTVWQTAATSKLTSYYLVSVNYSFNVIDEPGNHSLTLAYHRELERIFRLIKSASHLLRLQPHTHLEEYAQKQHSQTRV